MSQEVENRGSLMSVPKALREIEVKKRSNRGENVNACSSCAPVLQHGDRESRVEL